MLPGMPPIARRPLALVGAATSVLLVLFSARYGYHRDELYFLVAGSDPAFGYVDQPPLVPLLAHAVDAVSGGSIVALRAVAAVVAGALVFVGGLIARELGGDRDAQVLAAVCVAISGTTLAPGHLMTTTIVDLLVWSVLLWLLLRCVGVRRTPTREWLLVGLVAGIGLEVKTLVAALLAACLVGLVLVGPRDVLRSWRVLGAAAIALVLWAPNLVWQATNDWPQLELSRAIAAGGSATSSSPAEFVLLQLVQVSPVLVLVWGPGLWRLWRDPDVRRARFVVVAYVVLFVGFLLTGGKAYYLAGLYPTLLAAGAVPVVAFVRRGSGRVLGLAVALGVSLLVTAVITLPVLPPTTLADTPVPDLNSDSVETVGWSALAGTVAAVVSEQPPGTVVLTANYGEAGALARYRPEVDVYSGHNAFWAWGPPPADASTVVAVGIPPAELRRWFASTTLVDRIDTGVDDEEQGAPVVVGAVPRQDWSALWPLVRRIG